MNNLFMIFCLLCTTVGMSQVAINTDGTTSDNSAMLDIKSNNKGILVPRMTQTDRNAIMSPATGLMIYQSDNTPGFYYNSGTSGAPNWKLVGDGTLSLPYTDATSSPDQAFKITNTGTGDGAVFETSSATGSAVFGHATETTGFNYGVYGDSDSEFGKGVFGVGGSTGVYGISVLGYGVRGYGSIGVEGSANVETGWGVKGASHPSAANGGGVQGTTMSPTGVGIMGFATSTTGAAKGVKGLTTAANGYGVYGSVSATTGINYGVYGLSNSNEGIGVSGDVTSTTGLCKGVFGQSASYEGYGVYGSNTSTTGSAHGVFGMSSSTTGIGVEGLASGQVGWGIGVRGWSQWLAGIGLHGLASNPSGENYGVYGETWSSGGFSGYFEGGKFYISGYTGIGTEEPDCSLHIKAPDNASRNMLRIENNSGNTKILMRQNSNGSGGIYVYATNEENTIFLYGEGSSFINSGNLGIGTTTPTQLLDVNGNARFRAVGAGTYSTPLNITSDGTLTTSASDIRLKENVRTLKNSLYKVMQLRGVTFTWKENPGMGTRIGFIAQEVEYVYPELVFTNEVDGYKGVNYAEFSAVLVEAMKELKSEVNSLEAENDQLKSRLQVIEMLLQVAQ